MPRLFDTHTQLLERSLDFRSRRNTLLAANVANLETPGYKAKDLVFEDALGKAMQARQPGPLRVTDSRHLDGSRSVPLDQVQARQIRSFNPTGSLDGNTVDMEREMEKLAENQIAYQGMVRMVSHKLGILKTAVTEGGR